MHMVVSSARICLFLGCVVGLANSQRGPTNPFKQVFQPTEPPILYNLNHCANLTDGLAGFPTPDVSSAHIVQLHASTTLPSSPGVAPCVVSRVYLDVGTSWSTTTEYDQLVTTSDESYYASQDMWENVSKGLTRNQQIAVVSCDRGPTPVMPADTDFGFIFDAAKGLRLSVLQCLPGYCFVRITAPTCLKPWISTKAAALPGTTENMFKSMQKKVSMGNIGIHNMIMSIDEWVDNQTIQGTPVVMGLDVYKFSGYFVTTCIDTQNAPYTAEDAHYYGLKIMTTLKMISTGQISRIACHLCAKDVLGPAGPASGKTRTTMAIVMM